MRQLIYSSSDMSVPLRSNSSSMPNAMLRRSKLSAPRSSTKSVVA